MSTIRGLIEIGAEKIRWSMGASEFGEGKCQINDKIRDWKWIKVYYQWNDYENNRIREAVKG